MDVLKTEEQFKDAMKGKSSALSVVHFLAEWAPQCAQVTEVLKELKNDKECSKVQFIQVGLTASILPAVTDSARTTRTFPNNSCNDQRVSTCKDLPICPISSLTSSIQPKIAAAAFFPLLCVCIQFTVQNVSLF